MRQNSGSTGYSGAHTSPGTPEYGDITVEIPKPWSSERVPLPASSTSRRHISAAALMPFNSGRTLPSKWDDAERWITSPISGHGSIRTPVAQPQRRPKSKSGPLGHPGVAYASNYSPAVPGNVRNFMENTPLTTGVLVPEGISIQYHAMVAAQCGQSKSNASTNGLGLLDFQTEAKSSRDDNVNFAKEKEALVLRDVSHRDSATQISLDGSARSSSDGRFSFSTVPSSIPSALCPHGTSAAKDEVRDVQVDRGTTTSSQGKKRGQRKMKKTLTHTEALHSPWNASETSKNASKLQREEAKIAAWENLQKAKAEASIRELEMKLEKKRSASMDKILNKLRASQMKAESMRNSLSENRLASDRRISRCIYFNIYSLRNWFLCQRN